MMGCCITGVSGLFLEHWTTVQQSRARERKRVRETPPTKTGWVSRESGPDFSRREQEMRREWKKQGGREGSPPLWTLKQQKINFSAKHKEGASKGTKQLTSQNEFCYWKHILVYDKEGKHTSEDNGSSSSSSNSNSNNNSSSSSMCSNLHTCSAGCPAGRIRSSSC